MSPSFKETRTSYVHDRCPEIVPSEHIAATAANKYRFIWMQQAVPNRVDFEVSFLTSGYVLISALVENEMLEDVSGSQGHDILLLSQEP